MVSILIVNWNTKELLKNCLNALTISKSPIILEIIVVDNASQDQSADMVKEQFPMVKLIESPTNCGYAQGNNIAFQSASFNYILTLNPDTEVTPETIHKSILALQQHPECASLSLRFIGPNQETQSSVRAFPTVKNILGDILKIYTDQPKFRLGQLSASKLQLSGLPICRTAHGDLSPIFSLILIKIRNNQSTL